MWFARRVSSLLVLTIAATFVACGSDDDTAISNDRIRAAQAAVATGELDTVVAQVDGVPVTFGSVAPYLVALRIPGVDDAPEEPLDPPATVTRLLDPVVLAASATREGITVTDDEVTRFILVGLVEPLTSGLLSEDDLERTRLFLALAGTTPDGATTNASLRAAIRTSLLAGLYERANRDTPRDELLSEAWSRVDVTIVPGAAGLLD